MELIVDVIGIKCFRGTVQGSKIDSGSVFAIVRLDERYNRVDHEGLNWKVGHSVEEWKLPSAEAGLKMSHLKPSIKNPVAMRLEIERVSNGSEVREVIVDIHPVSGSVVDTSTGEIKQVAPVRKAA